MKKPIIEIKKLTKRFGDYNALCDIDLTVYQGEIYGIIGTSGAGKSTLFSCLTALQSPTSGQILIDGQEITSHSKEALRSLRKNVGLVFQHFNLFSSRTALENIAYPLEIASIPKSDRLARAQEMVRLVGLEGKEHLYPSQLSGGQKQRIAIARALSFHPKILLCDEATSALDGATTGQILGLLRELNQKLKVTILIITHEMQVIKEMCSRASVLAQGRVVESGLVTELFSKPKHSVTQKLLGSLPHQLDPSFFSEEGAILRLCFRGDTSHKPIISQVIKSYNVDINILLGSIDNLVSERVGNLLIQLKGTPIECAKVREFLQKEGVYVEHVER